MQSIIEHNAPKNVLNLTLIGMVCSHTFCGASLLRSEMEELWKPIGGYEGKYEISNRSEEVHINDLNLDRFVIDEHGLLWGAASHNGLVIIDLKNKTHNFTTLITKNNLISKNPNINLERSIKKVISSELTIKISRLVKEKIPVLITKPIGEAPKGYQFLDVWPFQLNMISK